jgi:hypothetical protein
MADGGGAAAAAAARHVLHRALPKPPNPLCLCAGVTEEQAYRYILFCQEFYFRKLDPDPLPGGQVRRIMDLTGIRMRDVSGRPSEFIQGVRRRLHLKPGFSSAFLGCAVLGRSSRLWS